MIIFLIDPNLVNNFFLTQGNNFGPINTGRCDGNQRPCQENSECVAGTGGGICSGLPVVSWNPTTGLYQKKDGSDVYQSTLCVVTKAHVEMQCDLVPGAGHTFEWTVTVGLQDSRTPTSSYHRPIVDTITGIGASTSASAGKTNGAQLVELHGLNFGKYSTPGSVSYGVTGSEYFPTGCVVNSHTKISCTTVPGIGADLFWRVTIRDQSNILQATTTYARPFIDSVTPISASSDGSDERGYLAFLKVSNSGLADPVTRRIVKFDTYEIPAEPDSPELTRREGDFDIIAFRIPKLYNRKRAVDVKISMVVFPYDKETGLAQRSSEVWSSNHILWKYDTPRISQVTVLDHPTNSDQLRVYLIGDNFGNIQNGALPEELFKMNVMMLDDQNTTTNLVQQLGADIANGPKTTFIQKWEQGADDGRYDKITVIWVGASGRLQITRGGEVSNIVKFNQITPQIKVASFWELEPTRKQIYDLPTLGSKTNGEGGLKTIQIDISCTYCGSQDLICLPQDGSFCPTSTDSVCKCSDIPDSGIPRDIDIWLGSTQLSDRELQNCPIKPGSYIYSQDQSGRGQWKFTCNVPAYQGSQVDTRVKYLGMWSEAEKSIFRPPVINTLKRSVGGTKGKDDFTKENYMTDPETLTYLEIPTNGDKIKLTGNNFGIDNHGAVTNYNTKYVSFDNIDMLPTAVGTVTGPNYLGPPHGGLLLDIPAGTGGRMRQIIVTTGQFPFDNQTSNAIDVTYRKPTIVDHLVPLWRFDDEGNAGGYEVRFFGYDFATSFDNVNNLLNKTTIIFKGTPCVVTETSYKTIKCKLGLITRDSVQNPITRITVSGQITEIYITDSRKTEAKNAVNAALYTQDDSYIHERATYRNTEFAAQVDKCIGTEFGSNGLAVALNASRQISIDTPVADRNIQQQVVAEQNTTLLTQEQKERVQCIVLVQQAFDKKCSRMETEESKAIVDAAYNHDEQLGKNTNLTKCWWQIAGPTTDGPSAIVPDGPSASTGPTAGSIDSIGALQEPIVYRITTTDKSTFDKMKLPTAGGLALTVEAYNVDKEYTRAILVDDSGLLPDVWVNNGELLPESAFEFSMRWIIHIVVPPGQGKTMRLKLISDRLGLASEPSNFGFDQLGYAPPIFDIDPQRNYFLNGIFGNQSVSSPTDSCERNQFESELSWAARIDLVGLKEREENPEYRRKCNRHFAITLTGINFGENTTTLKVWVQGVDMLTSDADNVDQNNVAKSIVFPVYDGTAYQTTDPNDRGFAGCQSSFCFQHHHDKIVVMGPEGYGADCVLWMSVAGQDVSVPFSFQKPEADESDPNPYNSNGDEITIHGQNFGGVASTAIVFIDGVECKSAGQTHATWFPIHKKRGLPYISCTAEQTMAGINNMSLFVAGQQSQILKIESRARAGVRSICKASDKEEDLDIITGQSLEYWGRVEPYRELCTKCVNGSGCHTINKRLDAWDRGNSWEYDPPFAVNGYYIQELDISGGRSSLFIDTSDIKTSRSELREHRDYKRALEPQNRFQRVCPAERLLDPVADGTETLEVRQELYKTFEAAVMNKRDFCLSVLPCLPKESCIGKNKCASNYEGQLYRCQMKRSETPKGLYPDDAIGEPIIQRCNHTLQCQAKSLGTNCVQALTTVCRCPADWNMGEIINRKTNEFVDPNMPSTLSTIGGFNTVTQDIESWTEYDNDRIGSHDCLKECVRDESKVKELVENGCSQDVLEDRLGDAGLNYDVPEDSAKCVPSGFCVNSTGILGESCFGDVDCVSGTCQTIGQCECHASTRCVQCTAPTHYRRDGKCQECPKNMALVIAGFFFGIVFLIIGMYYLDRQDFNLAFVSIPVDYFQVLALFSRSDIRWPPALLEILYALRFFNFNIDVATPECLLPGVFTYEHKFFGTLLLLPISIVFLLVSWAGHCCYRKIILHRSIDKLYSSKLVGTFLLCVYFMFLSCTTRALEIMNCSPTDPDDGWTYTTFTDTKCDGGGLCRCGDPEHLPLQLLPYAVAAILIYTIGFPVLLFWILRCGGRKNLIKEDQILRAAGVGDSLNTNGRAFYIRVKFHKMYYYFKPGKTYWLLYILTRKAGIATCGLIFQTNPGFMLAGVLLILFICYMVQVKHQPYMSTSQRRLVLAEHKIKIARGDALHKGIGLSIEKALNGQGNSREYQKARRVKVEYLRRDSGGGSQMNIGSRGMTKKKSLKNLTGKEKSKYESQIRKEKAAKKSKKEDARDFFFDYNTVEQVLLACAILVCLAGVMFESDRFQSEDASGNLRYGWMRDAVTVAIVTVVIGSLLYLVLVFMSEVIGYTPSCLQKIFADKKNHALLSAAEAIEDQQDNEVEMTIVNPAASVAQVNSAKELKNLQDKNLELSQMNDTLAAERSKLSKQNNQTKKSERKKLKKGRTRAKKKRNEFGAKQTSFGDDSEIFPAEKEAYNDDLPFEQKHLNPIKQRPSLQMDRIRRLSNAHNAIKKNSIKTNSIPEKKKSKVWKGVQDTTSGKTYYHNVRNNSVTWTKPNAEEIIAEIDL